MKRCAKNLSEKLATIALAATATPSPEVAEAVLALLDAGKVASLDRLTSPAGDNQGNCSKLFGCRDDSLPIG